MPRGQRKPSDNAPLEFKPGKTPQTPQERALDAVRKAFQKYDATQDRAIEADKRAGELWQEAKYLKKVFLHAGAHPDLPDDFNPEQFIADEQADVVEGEEVEQSDGVPDEKIDLTTQTTPDGRTDVVADTPDKNASEEDDPFAGV